MSSIETRIQARLAQSALLREIVEQEPDALYVLYIAALQTSVRDRWHAYGALKQIGESFAGFGARCTSLSTTAHHDALNQAIDTLLPEEFEQSA